MKYPVYVLIKLHKNINHKFHTLLLIEYFIFNRFLSPNKKRLQKKSFKLYKINYFLSAGNAFGAGAYSLGASAATGSGLLNSKTTVPIIPVLSIDPFDEFAA